MYANNDTQHRVWILLIATGIAILTVLSLQSLDIPVRNDVISVPDTSPVIEDWRGNSGHIPSTAPVPPALQKGFLR